MIRSEDRPGGGPACRMRAPVILRVVNGRFPEGRLAAVREALERFYIPTVRRLSGLDRYVIGTRRQDDSQAIAFMSVWADVESAVAAYNGNLDAVQTLDAVSHGEIL